jgi:hypothetical protein
MTAAHHLPPELARRIDWTVDDLVDLPPDLHYEPIGGRLILPSPTAFHPALSARHKAMREHANAADNE